MTAATLARPPAAIPNGLPWKPYTYQGTGTDTLTAWMDELDEELAPQDEGTVSESCGTEAAYARHRRRGEPIDAECRAADTRATLDRRRRREARRCEDCGYVRTSQNHLVMCGRTA